MNKSITQDFCNDKNNPVGIYKSRTQSSHKNTVHRYEINNQNPKSRAKSNVEKSL